jgi:hypothetical protein
MDAEAARAHKSHNHTSHVAPFQQPDILSCRAFSLQSADHFNTCERCQIIAVSVESIARSLQAYLGHRNIQNTTRYTALAPDRFKSFWRD